MGAGTKPRFQPPAVAEDLLGAAALDVLISSGNNATYLHPRALARCTLTIICLINS